MKYLIDGYNLMHASPLLQTGRGQKWLEKQRFRLLRALASMLTSTERSETVVVFDANESPKDLPSEYCFEGMRIRFARDHAQADDLIEEMIHSHPATQSLTVVSSDLRLQKAAKRRMASFSDSRIWFEQIQASIQATQSELNVQDPTQRSDQLKDQPLDAKEVAAWILEMGLNHSDDDRPSTRKQRKDFRSNR